MKYIMTVFIVLMPVLLTIGFIRVGVLNYAPNGFLPTWEVLFDKFNALPSVSTQLITDAMKDLEEATANANTQFGNIPAVTDFVTFFQAVGPFFNAVGAFMNVLGQGIHFIGAILATPFLFVGYIVDLLFGA